MHHLRNLRLKRPGTPTPSRCIRRTHPTRRDYTFWTVWLISNFGVCFRASQPWLSLAGGGRGSQSALDQEQEGIRGNMQIEIDQTVDQQCAAGRKRPDMKG